jgi:hypothetical protein
MEEQYYADRTSLRKLMNEHPTWTKRQLAEAVGRSESWVKKWIKRIQSAAPGDDSVLVGLPRTPRHPPASVHPRVVARILEIRDDPPENLQRCPGPKAILYYLHRDEALKASGLKLPTSTSTVWAILDAHGRIYRPVRHKHELLERPAPMISWACDFKDVSSVPADPGGKQQHGVECFNVIDVGTSVLLEAIVRDDFNGDRAIWAAVCVLTQYGLPVIVTFDRDPRFAGSWSGQDFPSPFVRFWLCLGVKTNICPPHRPDKNAFVERYHGNYESECLAVHRPKTLEHAIEVTATYRHHYNWERPSQALSCGNRPPRIAFPVLSSRPPLPQVVDPDRWLQAIDGLRYTRRINSQGSIRIDNRSYYVKEKWKGQHVTVKVSAGSGEFIVEYHNQPIKRVAIKGLYHEILDFADYLELIREEARIHYRRTQRERRLTRL